MNSQESEKTQKIKELYKSLKIADNIDGLGGLFGFFTYCRFYVDDEELDYIYQIGQHTVLVNSESQREMLRSIFEEYSTTDILADEEEVFIVTRNDDWTVESELDITRKILTELYNIEIQELTTVEIEGNQPTLTLETPN